MFTSAVLGFVGPLIILLSAVGVSVPDALWSGIVIGGVGVLGLHLLSLLRLNTLVGSALGEFVLGTAIGLALAATSGQLFRFLVGYRFAWLILPTAIICLSFQRPPNKDPLQEVGSRWRSNSEPIAMWTLIFLVMGFSAPIFTFAAIMTGLVHALIKGLERTLNGRRMGRFTAVWVSTFLLHIVTVTLGWRGQSPWTFSLPTIDTHIWTAKAWSTDIRGWTVDPMTSGVPSAYHFFGQAMAGLISRISTVSPIVGVSFVVPIITTAGVFAVLPKLLRGGAGQFSVVWGSTLVLLAAFSPLEPNSPLSTESFTFSVSIAFLIITAAVARELLQHFKMTHFVTLVWLSTIVTASKVNTGVIAVGVVCAITIAAALHRDWYTFWRALLCSAGVAIGVIATVSLIYLVPDTPSSYTVVFGFGSLEYRWALTGGPPFSAFTSCLILAILFLPAIICLYLLMSRWHIRSSFDANAVFVTGLLLSASGLMIGSIVLQFPPAGKAEIYLSTSGLVLFLIAGLSTAFKELSLNRYRPSNTLIWKGIAIALILVSVIAAAYLWSGRYQNWPSESTFTRAFLTPYVASLVAVITLSQTSLRTALKQTSNFSQRTRALVLTFLLCASIASVGANAAFGIRKPLNSLMGMIDNRVTAEEFVTELQEGRDLSIAYRPILEAVRASTPSDSVIASLLGRDGDNLIAAESLRQLWFSDAPENPRSGPILEHLSWRRETLERFLRGPTQRDARSMKRCAVTHVVVPNPTGEEFVIPGATRVIFRGDDFWLLELLGYVSDNDVPKVEWLKWCTTLD